MAKLDKVEGYEGVENEVKFMNISNSVGHSGVNNRDDVMLVQALFKISEVALSPLLKIKKTRFPYPTGTFDSKTQDLITEFQFLPGHYEDVWGEALLCPVKGGPYKPWIYHIWNILHLDFYLVGSALLLGYKDKFEAMYKMFPDTLFLFRE
jgi:hypothetical protein